MQFRTQIYSSQCAGFVFASFGEPLQRAEILSSTATSSNPPLTAFDGHLVLWFGQKPLVISKYIDFVVNPVFAVENKTEAISADLYFKPLLNAKLTRFVFIDQCVAQLQFDNGMYLLLSNTDYRDKEGRCGFFEIRPNNEPIDLSCTKIDNIVLTPGKTYSDSCDEFSERSVALLCGNEAILLHSYPEEYYTDHGIHTVKCSSQFIADYARRVSLPTINFEKAFYHQHKLSGIRLRCGSKYFYLFTDKYNKINLKLTDEKITSWEKLSHSQRSEKLHFELSPAKKNRFIRS